MDTLKSNEMLTNTTTIYLFNENGFITQDKIDEFCDKILEKSKILFSALSKKDFDPRPTIHRKLVKETLLMVVFQSGYVIKIEGEIREAILLLKDIDMVLNDLIRYHLSPSQRVKNTPENEYPRGATYEEIGQFLDKQFCNNDYSNIVKQSFDNE